VAFDSRGILKSATSTTGITATRGDRSQRLGITLTGRVTRDTAR